VQLVQYALSMCLIDLFSHCHPRLGGFSPPKDNLCRKLQQLQAMDLLPVAQPTASNLVLLLMYQSSKVKRIDCIQIHITLSTKNNIISKMFFQANHLSWYHTAETKPNTTKVDDAQ